MLEKRLDDDRLLPFEKARLEVGVRDEALSKFEQRKVKTSWGRLLK